MQLYKKSGQEMRNILLVFIVTIVSISSMLVNSAYGIVICVDKNNPTKVINCSDPNAVDKNTIKTSPTSKNTTTAPSQSLSVNTLPAKIQLLFSRVDHTSGYIFTTHYVVWGKVSNTGGTPSKPISVQIACTNTDSGAPLYSTTTPLRPSVLAPGDVGTFSQPISSNDLQGTKYHFSCTAQPISK
jgi:hypothetical protein